MRKCAPVKIKVYAPQTPEGKAELSRRIAQIHADAVTHRIRALNCPTYQQLQLVDSVIRIHKRKEEVHDAAGMTF